MNEIKVTTELCEKDRELLSDLTHAIVQLTIQLKGNTEAAEHCGKCFGKDSDESTEPEERGEAEHEQPENEPTEEAEPAEDPEKEQPKITQVDIQQKVVALSAVGKKAEVRDIIKKYADRVSAIAETAYREVWDELVKLEG